MFIAFIFGYNDNQPTLVLSFWLTNFFKFFIASLISLLIYTESQRFIAKKHNLEIKHELWGVERLHLGYRFLKFPIKLNFFKKPITIKNIPLGVIIPLIISSLSNGLIYFPAVLMNSVEIIRKPRIGFPHAHITDIEASRIRVVGPLACIFLAIILKKINPLIFTPIIQVNIWLALSNMIPLPKLDGFHILLTSRTTFVFSALFILLISILLNLISPTLTLIVSILLAIFGLLFYIYKYDSYLKA